MASSKEKVPPTTKATPTQSRRRKRNSEVKKKEQNKERHVIFSKRKLGLFNKLTELSILCQAETALILSSQKGKLYACGYPTPDAVIHRFVTDGSPSRRCGDKKKKKDDEQERVETLRLEYEGTINKLKEEKEKLRKMQETQKGVLDFTPWWNLDIEKMGLEDLEHFMDSLEKLKLNLVATNDAKKFNYPMPNMMIQSMSSNSSLILNSNNNNGNGFFNNGGYQAWNLMNGCGSSSSWNPMPMVP